MNNETLNRFVSILEVLKNKSPRNSALYNALEYILGEVQDEKVYVMHSIKQVEYDVDTPIASLKYLMCPRCHRVFSPNDATRGKDGYYCPECHIRLVQAYIGVPYIHGINQPNNVIHLRVQRQDHLIQPTSKIVKIECLKHSTKYVKRFKGLRTVNPSRPLQSLRFYCPYNDEHCEYYEQGFCSDTQQLRLVLFPPAPYWKNLVSRPSVAITKPLSITIFSPSPIEKLDVSVDVGTIKEIVGEVIPVVGNVQPGKFKVYELTIMYLLGHPYSGRYSRIPIINDNEDGEVNFLGRSLETDGILFKLDYSKVEEVIKEINSISGIKSVDPFTVAHSLSHVLLLALVRLTGLSPTEFGESIFVNEKEHIAEVLIYDNSPQGIGGVKTAVNNYSEFLSVVCNFAQPCPRACRSACRACVFFEACPLQNLFLSWRASTKAVNRGACVGGP